MIDLSQFRIAPGSSPDLANRKTRETLGMEKDATKAETKALARQADELQERLYAEGERAVLFVLQAMDGAGKDSTIHSVFGPLNPQGVTVASFKAPSKEELAHDFLWRVHEKAPHRGHIRVFNRSHYEDVLIVKVHGWAPPDVIERRYDHINAFEALLADAGTRVVKVMLHVSKDYQLERFRRRLERPDKHWKFNPEDLEERGHWDAYQEVFETALTRTSTELAPWYVIPSEKRWFRDRIISQLLVDTLASMDPQYPDPSFDPADYPPESLS